MPILASPVAHQRMAHPDGELAVARAAAAAGTIMCVPTFAMATPAEIAAEAPDAPRWFQLYWHPDREVTKSILDQAREAGCTAIVFTVDLPKLGRRERDLRTGFTLDPDYRMGVYGSELGDLGTLTPATAAELVDPRLTWRDLEWLHETARLPVIAERDPDGGGRRARRLPRLRRGRSSRTTGGASSIARSPRSRPCPRSSRPSATGSRC